MSQTEWLIVKDFHDPTFFSACMLILYMVKYIRRCHQCGVKRMLRCFLMRIPMTHTGSMTDLSNYPIRHLNSHPTTALSIPELLCVTCRYTPDCGASQWWEGMSFFLPLPLICQSDIWQTCCYLPLCSTAATTDYHIFLMAVRRLDSGNVLLHIARSLHMDCIMDQRVTDEDLWRPGLLFLDWNLPKVIFCGYFWSLNLIVFICVSSTVLWFLDGNVCWTPNLKSHRIYCTATTLAYQPSMKSLWGIWFRHFHPQLLLFICYQVSLGKTLNLKLHQN